MELFPVILSFNLKLSGTIASPRGANVFRGIRRPTTKEGVVDGGMEYNLQLYE